MFTKVNPSRYPVYPADEQDTEFARNRAERTRAVQNVFRMIGEALGGMYALAPRDRTRREV